MIEVFFAVLSVGFVVSMFGIAVPYAMSALGGALSERSGVINIALEGKLLFGAFGATIGAYYSGSVAVGVVCGIAAGVAVGALYAVVVVHFRADQIVAGVAINMLAYGLTRYLLTIPFDSTASSATTVGFGSSVLRNPVAWLAVAAAVCVYVVVYHTRFGLRLRAVGEHPEAASSLGISVARVRWIAVVGAGGLAGLGGAWLSLSQREFFAEMSGGRGYIALAAVIMGRWHPLYAAGACLFFGFAEALQYELSAHNVGVPSELLATLPYVLTMVTLAGFMGRARAPAALGKPPE